MPHRSLLPDNWLFWKSGACQVSKKHKLMIPVVCEEGARYYFKTNFVPRLYFVWRIELSLSVVAKQSYAIEEKILGSFIIVFPSQSWAICIYVAIKTLRRALGGLDRRTFWLPANVFQVASAKWLNKVHFCPFPNQKRLIQIESWRSSMQTSPQKWIR